MFLEFVALFLCRESSERVNAVLGMLRIGFQTEYQKVQNHDRQLPQPRNKY